MADTAPYTEEVWTYAGIRLDGGTKRTHAWLDPVAGKLRYWADRKSYTVGARYTMRIDRTREGGIFRSGDPVYAGAPPAVATEELIGWEIEHDRAERKLGRRAAEAKAKRQGGAIDKAAAEVCGLAAQAATFTDLEALIASVRQRMIAAWDTPAKWKAGR